MWLTGRLAPDFKTIADLRHDNGSGIRNVCRRFVELCRELSTLRRHQTTVEGGLRVQTYWTYICPHCPLKRNAQQATDGACGDGSTRQ